MSTPASHTMALLLEVQSLASWRRVACGLVAVCTGERPWISMCRESVSQTHLGALDGGGLLIELKRDGRGLGVDCASEGEDGEGDKQLHD